MALFSKATILVAMGAVAALLLLGGCARRDQVPGNITVAAYFVPPEKLEAFAADTTGKTRLRWTTPNFVLEPSNNPHRLMIDFEGVLLADSAVAENVFEVVWLIKQENQTGGPMQQIRFDRQNLTVSGTKVKGRAVGLPLSFKDKDMGAIELSLEHQIGLKPTAMTVSVRAGMENTNWLETLLSLNALMVGLVFLGLVLWWRR
jgi:hypothetical protein